MTTAVQHHAPSAPIDPIVFTDAAAAKVLELVNEEKNPDLKLRVFITGGGCSGFQYGFTFDEEANPDDMVIEKKVMHEADATSVKLLIDSASFQYLLGSTIDYKEDLQGSQFTIKNPQAKATCGCGSSFSI